MGKKWSKQWKEEIDGTETQLTRKKWIFIYLGKSPEVFSFYLSFYRKLSLWFPDFVNALLLTSTQYVLSHYSKECPGAQPGTPQISEMESFLTIVVNGYLDGVKPFTIAANFSISDVCEGPGNASDVSFIFQSNILLVFKIVVWCTFFQVDCYRSWKKTGKKKKKIYIHIKIYDSKIDTQKKSSSTNASWSW